MCDPVSGTAFLLSAAKTAVEYGGKVAEYQQGKAAYKANAQNAKTAMVNEQRQTSLRQMQENAAYAQKDRLAQIDNAKRQASISVSAAGANVEGLTLDNVLADVSRQTEANRATLQTNYEMTAAQLQTEREATVTRAKSRIGQVNNPAFPSPVGAVLQVATAGFGEYKNSMAM